MRQPLRHHLLALGLTVAVNAALLAGFVRLNALVDLGPREASAAPTTVVDFTAPPPPKPRARPRPRRTAAKVARVTPRVPALPSAIQDPDLLDALGDVDLLGEALADEIASSDLLLAEDQVDRPPEVVSKVAPTYPDRALDRALEGWVDLLLVVDRDGVVRELEVVDADPAGVFEDAATAAVWQWRYTPAVYQGRTVRCRYRQRVLFRLR